MNNVGSCLLLGISTPLWKQSKCSPSQYFLFHVFTLLNTAALLGSQACDLEEQDNAGWPSQVTVGEMTLSPCGLQPHHLPAVRMACRRAFLISVCGVTKPVNVSVPGGGHLPRSGETGAAGRAVHGSEDGADSQLCCFFVLSDMEALLLSDPRFLHL